MVSFNADTKLPREPVSALTVVPFSTGTLVVIAVNLSCLRPRAVWVAYVELMSTPPTCSAVALSVPMLLRLRRS